MSTLSRTSAGALVALLFSPSAASSGPFDHRGGCSSALHDIAGMGHTDLELSAYCHATLPPAFCRDAIVTLGSQPWSSSHISSACSKWEGQWSAQAAVTPERGLQDWGALQSTIQSCMKAKADAGLCQDPKTKKPMSLDQCIDHKQRVYPEKTRKMQEAMNNFYNAAMGITTPAPKPEAAHPVKKLGSAIGKLLGKKFEERSLDLGFGSGWVCGMVLGAALASLGGVISAKRAWKRHGGQGREALVLAEQEDANEEGA